VLKVQIANFAPLINKNGSLFMKIGILGGGISGLSLGFFLRELGEEVLIIESTKRVGGAIKTESKDGFTYEFGPNSLLNTSSKITDLIKKIGLESELIQANAIAKNRYIVKNGSLVALPSSLVTFISSSLFSFKAKLRLLKEPFIPKGTNENESLSTFVSRRLGQEFLDYAINPFVAGVYAGDPNQLSVKYAFKKLFELEQKYGSLIKGQINGAKERKKRGEVAKNSAGMISFKNGLGSLITYLEKYLEASILKDCSIEAIHQLNDGWSVSFKHVLETADFDLLINTIPAHKQMDLPFTFLKKDNRKTFQEVYYPPVTVVQVGYEKSTISHELDGFGYLTPEKEGRKILGCLFSSQIFDNRAPQDHILLTNYIGGARQPEQASLSDNDLLDLVYEEHKQLLGAKEKPVFSEIIRWKKAIPQYTTHYAVVKMSIEEMEKANPGLVFSGNWVNGISMSDCITQAAALAEKLTGKTLNNTN
jgi:protoporphyrinogen/coproporphyrinogen III oxidase